MCRLVRRQEATTNSVYEIDRSLWSFVLRVDDKRRKHRYNAAERII